MNAHGQLSDETIYRNHQEMWGDCQCQVCKSVDTRKRDGDLIRLLSIERLAREVVKQFAPGASDAMEALRQALGE